MLARVIESPRVSPGPFLDEPTLPVRLEGLLPSLHLRPERADIVPGQAEAHPVAELIFDPHTLAVVLQRLLPFPLPLIGVPHLSEGGGEPGPIVKLLLQTPGAVQGLQPLIPRALLKRKMTHQRSDRGLPRLVRQFLKDLEAFLKDRERLPMLSLRLVDGPDLGQGPAGPWSIPPRFTSIQFCHECGKAHLSLPRGPLPIVLTHPLAYLPSACGLLKIMRAPTVP